MNRQLVFPTWKDCYLIKVIIGVFFKKNLLAWYLGLFFTSNVIVKGTTLLKSKKASGYDSMSNEMIKESLPSASSFWDILFHILNPDNCHGIKINGCFSKLFNLLPNNRLLCPINETGILKNNQISFGKHFRTAWTNI